ncbi:phosphate regulon sensor histidine kinase PhoR [Ideonella sp. A 288]|uniref:phosphate regulon sensor histidine kinase PhoR n=1 Tax=Ideonella sp. A 288 TaxID=1962181 RepID=UPI000B4BF0C0|nr:phosphate regulon sensor histidine kinase PhoR [Ideonella sp. A 288]
MSSLLQRLPMALASLAVGGVLGRVLGEAVGSPLWGLTLGGVVGSAAWVLLDDLRASRLVRWLSMATDREAPHGAGLWGEMGYLVERALRQRDQALARERDRLTQFLSAIEASPNGVLLLDPLDHIDWCSLVAADHLGLDARRDLRQPITNLVRSPEFVSYLKAGDWDEPVTFALPGGGCTLTVLVRGYGDGQKLVLSQDVTERLRADTMRRDFVANVSHEIRTPLTVLAGFLETMESLPLSETERARMQALMRQQTDRMQVLVADLLTLAQLEGSPRPPADRWVSVDVLVQRVLQDGEGLSKGRHPITAVGLDGAAIAGIESELQSALSNLLSNAVRYTPAGGQIEVTWLLRADGSGELGVTDSGMGIAREHLSRLTERFYRVDGSRSRETGGTGLGLSIVKHVMQRHGGNLDIESEPGKGSTFRLQFPSGRVRPGHTAISGPRFADTPA